MSAINRVLNFSFLIAMFLKDRALFPNLANDRQKHFLQSCLRTGMLKRSVE
jgi:hypothetical protein